DEGHQVLTYMPLVANVMSGAPDDSRRITYAAWDPPNWPPNRMRPSACTATAAALLVTPGGTLSKVTRPSPSKELSGAPLGRYRATTAYSYEGTVSAIHDPASRILPSDCTARFLPLIPAPPESCPPGPQMSTTIRPLPFRALSGEPSELSLANPSR